MDGPQREKSAFQLWIGKLALLSGWKRALAAFLAGGCASFALPPYDFIAAAFMAFPVLVWLIDGATGGPDRGGIWRLLPAALTGWWFGFGYFVLGLWWIGNALLVDAQNFAWAIPFAILGLPAFLALFYGLGAAIARLVWSDGLGRIFALAFGLGLAEWLRSFLLTGFPWNAIGYAAMPVPLLMQSSAAIGLLAMNVLAVIVFAMPALVSDRLHRLAGAALAIVLIGLHVGYGALRLSNATIVDDGPQVRIVQPSIAQDMKWDADARRDILDKYLDLTRQPPAAGAASPQIIVWPETAVPYLLTKSPDAMKAITETLGDGQTLLAGAIRLEEPGGEAEPAYYNSIYVIDGKNGITGAADKVHLVPFGEYLPLEHILRRLGLTEVVEMPGGFTPAASRRSLPVLPGFAVLPLICYEAIFPGEMDYAGSPANAIVNVTNDAWYGDTPGPYQHFRQAQLRAVELGLPLIRAANNGLSAVVDPYGRIIDGLALNAVGVSDVRLPARIRPPMSEATRNAQFWVVILAVLVATMTYFLRHRRRFG
ncbi:apolipoprotein N-acyltransferase [Phyllobacterium sp. 21LDTY02-6]|uniref:apolipoprotein N-acyltransferase n=1 Tax=Phyllobacterium sp. 21LDTY02-6 TaxID=2944903 RepID=UPI0020217836|nr:apolipoprotein N-acyltransferase [Phyllobacterium sp. 21LDTY02-6]MCO4316901.1 apolipoprotein N-acyltransferase [Phyllobacterium sp. 21LDTY02-6]